MLVDRNTSLTTSQRFKARRPSIRSPASNEIISDSVELWDIDVCFLHIQLTPTSVRLPNIHKLPVTEVDFKSSRSPAKSESWKKNQSTVLCCVAHVTMVLVVICMMDIRNQSCQTSAACLSPLCDCTSKFVDREQNVWSTDACQVQSFHYNLSPYF